MQSQGTQPGVPGHATGSFPWMPAVVILLTASLFRLFAMTGDIRYDPAVYAQYAHNLVDGTFRLATDCWYAHRLPVFVPAAFAYAAMGVGTLSTGVWTLLLSIFQVGTVIWLGHRWLGREVAILGACFLVFLPLDVIYAGILGPDEVIATFVTMAAAAWIWASEAEPYESKAYLRLKRWAVKWAPAAGRRAGRGDDVSSPASGDGELAAPALGRRAKILLFLSGLCLALATVTRLYSVLLVFFFAGVAFSRRGFLKKLLWCSLGFIAVGIPLLLVYIVVTGDPLLPLKAVFGFYASPERSEGARLLYYPSLIWNPKSEAGIFPLLSAVAVLVALVRPTRKRWILLGWMAPLLIYLQFGSMSLDSYVPIFKRTRFLTPMAAPAALLLALVILEEIPLILGRLKAISNARQATRFLAAAVVVIFAGHSLRLIANYRSAETRVASDFRRAAAVLRSDRKIPIFFDHWRTAIRFGYYLDFKEGSHLYEGADETTRMNRERAEKNSRLGYLKWYGNAADLPDGFVVLEDQILAQALQAAAGDPGRSLFPAKDIPAYCDHPPESWKFLGRFGSVRIFRTGNL